MNNVCNILDTIGNTPLVKLEKICPQPHITIYAKLEYFNPGLSIKDRIVKHIIEEAEKSGELKPGGTIVENTSGNTGAAVAMISAIKGYKAILTMPDKVSIEKQNTLRALGAEVVVCPTEALPGKPDHYVQKARDLAASTPNSFMINQYDNLKNREAHYLTTGPEIWQQTSGNVDYFVAGGSTGGTVSGTGKYLKEQNQDLKVVVPDPKGSIFYKYFHTKEVDENEIGSYFVEGVGEDHLTKCMDFDVVDEMMQYTDKDAFGVCRDLAEKEGILVGGSAGGNMWVCLELAKRISTPCTIVTVFPDSGIKYLSKIFDGEWLKSKDLL